MINHRPEIENENAHNNSLHLTRASGALGIAVFLHLLRVVVQRVAAAQSARAGEFHRYVAHRVLNYILEVIYRYY
jgi:hypothetical protein